MRNRVLIVDVDLMQAQILAKELAGLGFYADTAGGGVEALLKARSGFYTAVLIDFQMPVMDGLAISRIIRGTMACDRRPALIALTRTPEEITARYGTAGAYFEAIATKPVSPSDLVTIIDQAMRAVLRTGSEVESPAAGGTNGAMSALTSGSECAGPARVLLVDDDEAVCVVLSELLRRNGFAVETATSGLAAIRLSTSRAFDVVVMDYIMPDMDGHATAELMFNFMRREERPGFIAYTAGPEQLVGRDAEWAQIFDELVPKVNGMPALVDTVTTCASLARHRRANASRNVIGVDALFRIATAT